MADNALDVLLFGYRWIRDAAGAVKPKRRRLQFIGADVEDDEANDTTVVTISGGGSDYSFIGAGGIGVTVDGDEVTIDGTNVEGQPGAPGADGRTILSGSTVPAPSLGDDGDLYINTSAHTYYVKAGGDWGAPTSLVGPQGADGAPGADGESFLPPAGVEGDIVGLDGLGGVQNLGQGAEVPAGAENDVVGLDSTGGLKSLGRKSHLGSSTLTTAQFVDAMSVAYDHCVEVEPETIRQSSILRVLYDGTFSTAETFFVGLPPPSTVGASAYFVVADVADDYGLVTFGLADMTGSPSSDTIVELGADHSEIRRRLVLLVLNDRVLPVGGAAV